MRLIPAFVSVLLAAGLLAQEPARPAAGPDDLLDVALDRRPALPANAAEAEALLRRIGAGIERVGKETAAAPEEEKARLQELQKILDGQRAEVLRLQAVLAESAETAPRLAAIAELLGTGLPARKDRAEAEKKSEEELARKKLDLEAVRQIPSEELERKSKQSAEALRVARQALAERQAEVAALEAESAQVLETLSGLPAAIEAARKEEREAEDRLKAAEPSVRAAEGAASPSALRRRREEAYALRFTAAAHRLQADLLERRHKDLVPQERNRIRLQLETATAERDGLDLRVARLKDEDQLYTYEHTNRLTEDEAETERLLATAPPYARPFLGFKKRRHEIGRKSSQAHQVEERWADRFGPAGEMTEAEREARDHQGMLEAGREADSDLPRTTSGLGRLVSQVEARIAQIEDASRDLESARAFIREDLPAIKREEQELGPAFDASMKEAWRLGEESGKDWDWSYLDVNGWWALRESLREALVGWRVQLSKLAELSSKHRERLSAIDAQSRRNLEALRARFLWTREESAISWAALGRAVEDCQHLPESVAAESRRRWEKWSAWISDPGNRGRAIGMGGAIVFLVLCGIVIHRKMPRTWLRHRSEEGAGRFVRFFATLARRTEIVLILALGFAAFCLISGIHPRETGAIALVFLVPFAYRFGRVLNELLFAPESTADRVFRVEDATARTLHATFSLLLRISLFFVPIGFLLSWQGYGAVSANPGFLELWWFVFQTLFYVILLVGVFRPRTILRLVRGQGELAVTVKSLLLLAYPLAAGAVIFLFVLGSLRYEAAAAFFRGVFLQAAGILILAFVVYRLLLGRFFGGRDFHRTVLREDFDSDPEFMAAGKKLATDLLARLGTRVLVFGAAAFFLYGIWEDVRLSAVSAGARSSGAYRTLADLAGAVVFGWAALIVLRHFRRAMRFLILPSTRWDTGVQYAVLTLSSYGLLAVALTLVLRALRVDGDQVAWFIAPLGVGIGFGLQDIVKGFVAGIVLLVERPVRVGDQVNVAGQTGVVEKINLRSTTLMTFENVGIIVPNEQMVSGILQNRAAGTAFIRTSFAVGIAYDSDVKLAMKIMSEAMNDHGLVRKKPAPEVFMTAYGESSLDFECRFWARVIDHRLRITSDLRSMIHSRFQDAGIEIPFPQRDLNIRSVSEQALRQGRLLGATPGEGNGAGGGGVPAAEDPREARRALARGAGEDDAGGPGS